MKRSLGGWPNFYVFCTGKHGEAPARKEREKGRAPDFVCGESMGQPPWTSPQGTFKEVGICPKFVTRKEILLDIYSAWDSVDGRELTRLIGNAAYQEWRGIRDHKSEDLP